MINTTTLQSQNRDKLGEFAQAHVNTSIEVRDQNRNFDRILWKKCSELNLHGVFVSKDYGGLDYSLNDGMSMLESMGYHFRDNGLSFSIIAQLTSCSYLINKYGSLSQKSEYLEKIVNGEIIFAHGLTESTSGSDVFDMSTHYSLDERKNLILIRGSKNYSSNLPVANYLLCYAVKKNTANRDNMVTSFLIPTKLISNIQTIQKLGLNTCTMGMAELDLSLEPHHILGEEETASSRFQEAITYERIGMSACHLGTIERLLNECINWTNTRMVGGQPLSSKQVITHKLVDIHNEWTTLRSYFYNLTSAKLSFSKLFFNASILKDKVSELYTHTCRDILQIYGGLGYTKNHEIERMLRDSTASKIYSGTSEIQKEIVWNFIK